jgi:hypothetical protein
MRHTFAATQASTDELVAAPSATPRKLACAGEGPLAIRTQCLDPAEAATE